MNEKIGNFKTIVEKEKSPKNTLDIQFANPTPKATQSPLFTKKPTKHSTKRGLKKMATKDSTVITPKFIGIGKAEEGRGEPDRKDSNQSFTSEIQ